MSYIRLVNVTKRFGNVTAVDNLNLEIGKGECFSMLGPSGCGKTTTLRMVAGFEDLSDGEVWVGDRLLSSPKKHHYTPPENRNFGMVFQAFAVWPHMSVYENVAFAMRVVEASQKEIRKRVPMVLSLVGLSHKYKMFPNELSGGEQQRVSLARAIVNNPSVLIADEPTGNLDPDTAKEIMELLEDINKSGTTIVMATHAKDIVDNMKKRVIAIEKGSIVRDDRKGMYENEN